MFDKIQSAGQVFINTPNMRPTMGAGLALGVIAGIAVEIAMLFHGCNALSLIGAGGTVVGVFGLCVGGNVAVHQIVTRCKHHVDARRIAAGNEYSSLTEL